MKHSPEISPPRWATRFLAWYCKPSMLEDLEGDLYEYFQRNVDEKGILWARVVYVIDVLKFFRLYTIRKPEVLNVLIHWIMIRNYVKISGRIILRNRLFSFINIVGLAISMAVGLLLIGLLSDMSLYDKFHENHDRIYRVISKYKYLEQEDNTRYASTSLRAAEVIEESVPGIEEVAVLYRGFSRDIKAGDRTVSLSGHWAGESFFDVFSFPMVGGDPSTALINPYSIVLTEESAMKLFGDADALGKTIVRAGEKGDEQFVVTGVIQNVPVFSHLKFDMLVSLSTRAITEKDNGYEMSWDHMWSAYVYLLLPAGSDLQNIQTNLDTLSAREDKTVRNTRIRLSLQPLSEIALGEDLNNSIGPVMVRSNVWMIGVLSVI